MQSQPKVICRQLVCQLVWVTNVNEYLQYANYLFVYSWEK